MKKEEEEEEEEEEKSVFTFLISFLSKRKEKKIGSW